MESCSARMVTDVVLAACGQATAVPHKRFQSGLAAIGEQEQMAAGWVLAQVVAHQSQTKDHAPSTMRIRRLSSESAKGARHSMRRPLATVMVKPERVSMFPFS